MHRLIYIFIVFLGNITGYVLNMDQGFVLLCTRSSSPGIRGCTSRTCWLRDMTRCLLHSFIPSADMATSIINSRQNTLPSCALDRVPTSLGNLEFH